MFPLQAAPQSQAQSRFFLEWPSFGSKIKVENSERCGKKGRSLLSIIGNGLWAEGYYTASLEDETRFC